MRISTGKETDNQASQPFSKNEKKVIRTIAGIWMGLCIGMIGLLLMAPIALLFANPGTKGGSALNSGLANMCGRSLADGGYGMKCGMGILGSIAVAGL